MTISLELSPEEAAVLSDRAARDGVDIKTVLHRLVAGIAPPEAREATEKQKTAVALRQPYGEPEQADDPEEQAERERELREFKANINRWRAEQGRPPVH